MDTWTQDDLMNKARYLSLLTLVALVGSFFTFSAYAKSPAKKSDKIVLSKAETRAHNAEVLANIDKNLPKRDFEWRYIVIHHTASEWSSRARIDRYHREKFDDPDGIEYHFLIGNGKKAPAGYIELGRWPLQKRAIHLFKPEGAPQAIAVSLVGNLHEREIEKAQYDALVDLVVTLSKTYDIPPERITTHTGVDGRLTVCPGKNFPYKRLLKDVRARLDAKEEEDDAASE
ncbi:MAG: peptidoglycan recognition family protein [Myxococcota bacterium]|nr:peptidoglycan recognition family protein [Myxococcota bacterium]